MATNAPYERPTAAFVLSLLAGLWMLAMGGWLMSWSPTNSQWGWGGMILGRARLPLGAS
jgi:hypothetical protein